MNRLNQAFQNIGERVEQKIEGIKSNFESYISTPIGKEVWRFVAPFSSMANETQKFKVLSVIGDVYYGVNTLMALSRGNTLSGITSRAITWGISKIVGQKFAHREAQAEV